jgi:adenine-specific DNA methylase
MLTFIETQFPIARLSAESYKERKANNGQTLTRLGKWWGRKPLILVRASILGMLMPASDNPKKDREIFLKILTMDDDGAWQRCKGEIPAAAWRNAAPPEIQDEYFGARGFKQGMTDEEKEEIVAQIWESLTVTEQQALDDQRRRPVPDRATFDALTYAERLQHCERPENVTGPTTAAWAEINAHLGTTATRLPELVEQLGQRTFGHTPRVGDSFCGGGSIPFEAARIGCKAFGSDLNPVAGLLTWASLHLLGGGKEVQEDVMRVQAEALAAADEQVIAWGIERNDRGERADAYLYCVEVKPEGCDYFIPLAPSWLVGEKSKVVATWRRVTGSGQLQPEIIKVEEAEVKDWKGDSKKKIIPKNATVADSRVIDPFDPSRSWSVEALRGPEGLRRWTNEDLVPRSGDVFQERLYCIRWINDEGNRRYAAPEAADLAREAKVLELLHERFADWQRKGFIPSKAIISGYNTEQPIRERGWTHWHHLFTPRQLLTHGLLAEVSANITTQKESKCACLLGLGRMADWNSRLSAWMFHKGNEKGNQVFYNQALNCHFNYSARPLPKLEDTFSILGGTSPESFGQRARIIVSDARDLRDTCDLWVTDPPYADAINYHELGDFFLAWYDKQLANAFPEWTSDARAELAVRGDGEDFRRSMVEIYHNLSRHMPDNGLQMVMFTHQDPAVWADLGMILWAAGLKAAAAWTISTETEAAGIKKGNYVQGTVCLVLRKRSSNEPGFLDEVYPLVEDEVKRQIESMQSLDEDGEPNFNDADYNLAAYAAALKVLTQYGTLDGRDVAHEVFAVRTRNEKSDFQEVIERALGIACDMLVPRGLDASWRELSLVERYYLRALDIESRGERRKGMYEELARGFGVTDIKPLLKSDKANGARMHTPSGFAAVGLAPVGEANFDMLPARRGRTASGGPHPFAASALRHLLFAIKETCTADNSPEPGRQYLRDTFGQGYWGQRERFIALLEWLAALGNAKGMNEWINDSESARILAGRLRNDHA